MAGKKRVGALVQRFEAAQSSTKSSTAAGAWDAPDVVVKGSVEELIALFNGMARSLPDFPRSAYTRSTRSRPLEPPLVVDEESAEPQERTWEEGDAAADDEEEEELSTCDETASIHSLSSSFMSDSSFDDHASEASLYYELEYLVHHHHTAETDQGPEHEPEEDLQPSKITSDPTCGSASLKPDAEPVTLVHPLSSSAVAEIAQVASSVFPESEAETATPRIFPPDPTSSTDGPIQAKHGQHEPLPKMPRTLLPSKIPIRRGSSLARAVPKASKPFSAAVSGGLKTSRTSSAGSPTAKQREHCEPSVPRSPVKQEICRRFAAANTPSPRKPTQPRRRSGRRHSISDFKPETIAAPTAAAQRATATMTKERLSITASSARFLGTKAPASFVSFDTVTVQSVQPKSQFKPIAHHPHPINSRATAGATWTRESLARPPTPPSAFIPVQNAEIRLDSIKSRLFDYENDPKRLEVVAANRARRKSLEARAAT